MDDVELLKRVYALFNARDMERVLATMHEDVVWANGMDGGYVHGREGVRDYWTRQWAQIDPHVEPVGFSRGADGEIVVEVHAVVRDLGGNLLHDHMVGHVFRFDQGLVTRFDIRQPPVVPDVIPGGTPEVIPEVIAELVDELMTMTGVVAVALGGSRALGVGDDASDWDLGVYYRGDRGGIDLRKLEARGQVYPPGSWGRLMNGGAWLRCGGTKVDVLLRDLEAVEYWGRRAEEGEFEIDALLGYVAGVPTYLLSAELASNRTLRGELPAAPFPEKLRAAAPAKWRFCRSFSLDHARSLARRGNVVGAVGQAAKAVMEEAHAVMCERGRWVCNERRLIEAAGLSAVQASFRQIPGELEREPESLVRWVDGIANQLQAAERESMA